MIPSEKKYNQLLDKIGFSLEQGKQKVSRAINTEILHAKWEIGKHIVLFEQEGSKKAEYGTELLDKLSKDLKLRHGKGFSRRSVLDMRRFYVTYPKWQTVSAVLSWSHYVELLGIKIDHADIGQMSMYLGYFKKEEMIVGENDPIGIILSKEKDEILVEYTTTDMSKNLFVSEYQLHLPDKKELEEQLNKILNE